MRVLAINNYNNSSSKTLSSNRPKTIANTSLQDYQNTKYAAPSLYLCHFPNINTRKLSFGAINFINVSRLFEAQREALRKEIEIFSKSQKNADSIGKGISAEAFLFDRFPNIVIKKPFVKSETFADEEKNMLLVPEHIKNSQRFVARAQDDTDGYYYLLSTKVKGEFANPRIMPWTRQHLKSLFDTMFEFDKVGLHHGDLNKGNMKLADDGTVNFLDYQWSKQVKKINFFDGTKVKEQTLPRFIHCQNSQMFEMAELPYYLKEFDNPSEAKNFLKLYLTEKANYHSKRYNFLEKETSGWQYDSELQDIKDGLDFERAQSIILANPTDDILKLEAKKIQFLNSSREAYKRVDANVHDKNIIPAGSAHLMTLSAIQDFRKEVARQQKRASSQIEKDYLKGQEKYGNFWFENLKEWTPGNYRFPVKHITRSNLENWETELHNFENPNVDIEQFGAMTNVISGVDENYLPNYSKNFSVLDSSELQSNMQQIKATMSGLDKYAMNNPQINHIKLADKRLEKAQSMLDKAHQSGWGLDVLNSSILCALRARQLKEAASKSQGLTGFNQNYSVHAKDVGTKMEKFSIDTANLCFRKMFDEIIDNGISSSNMIGYKNMGNFGI